MLGEAQEYSKCLGFFFEGQSQRFVRLRDGDTY